MAKIVWTSWVQLHSDLLSSVCESQKQRERICSCIGLIIGLVRQDQCKLILFSDSEVMKWEVPWAKPLKLHTLFWDFVGFAAVAGSRMVLCPHIHQGRGEYMQVFSVHLSGIHLFTHSFCSIMKLGNITVPRSLGLNLHKSTNCYQIVLENGCSHLPSCLWLLWRFPFFHILTNTWHFYTF